MLGTSLFLSEAQFPAVSRMGVGKEQSLGGGGKSSENAQAIWPRLAHRNLDS